MLARPARRGRRRLRGFDDKLPTVLPLWPESCASTAVSHNVTVGTVLVSLEDGAGVLRQADGVTLVTGDVTKGWGTCLRPEDPYQPASTWMDDDRSVVGGLLAPGVVSVDVVDHAGRRLAASIGDGAYAAILAQPNRGEKPVVCWRDAAGAPMRRPLPAAYPSVRVTDATEPCPACGAVDYEECTPTEQWRGGTVNPDGTRAPSPLVVCRICGHQEREGAFYALHSDSDDTEDEAAREARLARAEAEARLQRWYSDTMTVRAATSPIYAADGWPARVAGSQLRGTEQTSITIRHDATPQSDAFPRVRPTLEVTTSVEPERGGEELPTARVALESWLHSDGGTSPWPDASHAAITLWLSARDRDVRARVLNAERSVQPIAIDGAPESFLTLTTPTGGWVAVRNHGDLTITLAAAHGLDPATLTIEPIAEPAARLLGPQPPDPDAA